MARYKPRSLLLHRLSKSKYIITLILLLLIIRIFYIQIIKGDEYSARVDRQQTLRIPVSTVSGDITDRNGIPFTNARKTKELIIFPEIVGDDETAYNAISRLTGKTLYQLQNHQNEKKRYHILQVKTEYKELLEDIDKGEYIGIILVEGFERYDENSLARHVIGHIRASDGIPVSGIEKRFEKYLHPGAKKVVNVFLDAADRLLPGLGHTVSKPSDKAYDVRLTMDYHIQKILEDALEENAGIEQGGVVIDIETGDILALASRPHYDQNNPLSTLDASYLAIPLQQYEPGSVFKIIVAAAALEHGGYADRAYKCRGGIQVGGNFISCHSRGYGVDQITLKDAFAYSCNDTFISIAMELGGDVIVEMARRFGIGEASSIELYNDIGRLMSKEDYRGAGIANLAIGQGDTQITPLQAADMVATIANGGIRKDISLVKDIIDESGKLADEYKPNNPVRVIGEETAKTLMDYMCAVTEYGTGQKAQDSEIGGTAGKTGTPEVSVGPGIDEYGWFAGFFPQKNPKYAIVIMCKEKGGGGNIAAPVFKNTARGIYEYEKSLKGVNH